MKEPEHRQGEPRLNPSEEGAASQDSKQAASSGSGMPKLIYLNDQSPDFDLPPYRGEHYASLVPDTFDVQERAALVQHVMTHAVDPDQDYQIYFGVEMARNPTVMGHGSSDLCQAKYLQALPLIRLITGDEELMEVERTWLEVAFKQLGPDGLSYLPLLPHNKKYAPQLDHGSAKHFCYNANTYLPGIVVQQLRHPSKLWDGMLRRMVDGLKSVAIDRRDWAYIPKNMFTPGHPRPKEAPVPKGTFAAHYSGFCLQGLAAYYRISGYEPAGTLARKLSYYLKDHAAYFDGEGRFLSEYPPEEKSKGATLDTTYAHFHSHTLCLLNMLEYALPAGDSVLIEHIQKSFEWARTQGEALMLDERNRQTVWPLGYFPEQIFVRSHETAETCEVADMIGLGLKLSAAGVGDYWDDADGWIRNQFAENQVTETGWLHEFSQSFPKAGPVEPRESDVDVIERNRGGFAGWAMANAWMNHIPEARTMIMHCCTGNGARAIYTIWEHILHHTDGKLRVNLLLNRASLWADVDSYLPSEGKVEVRVKTPLDLEIRIPGWAPLPDVRCRVDDATRSLSFDGRYAKVGSVIPGQIVRLDFPVAEKTMVLEIEKRRYEVVFRGADAVSIDPPGVCGPFYQRERYRCGRTPMKKVSRFVSSEEIDW